MVTQVVVASVPFLPNSAQSACGMVSTRSSASSTWHSDGPRHDVAAAALVRNGGFDIAIAVAEHDRAVAAHQVDILFARHIPKAASLRAAEELRITGMAAGRHSYAPTCPRG